MHKSQDIPGVEECLELLQELETKDLKAAQTLVDDAFGFESTPEGPANAAGGMFSAWLGRPKEKPSTFPLQKGPEIDYTDAIRLVEKLKKKVEEKLQELKLHQSTLPDPAPRGAME